MRCIWRCTRAAWAPTGLVVRRHVMLPRHEAATAHIALVPVTSHALDAAHDTGARTRGITAVACAIARISQPRPMQVRSALLAQCCAARVLQAISSRKTACQRGQGPASGQAMKHCCLHPGGQDAAARGEVAAARPSALMQRRRGHRARACPMCSSTASVGLSERSRSTGCTSPALHCERGGRGSGRTKRSRAASLQISNAYAGDAAGTAACCRLQPTVARASPNLSSILDVTQHSEAPCGEG
jgi:hypothetical protein